MQTGLGNELPFSLRDFVSPHFYRPMVVCLGLLVLMQLVGINAITFNAETIFRASGFKDDQLAAVVIGEAVVVIWKAVLFIGKVKAVTGNAVLVIRKGSGCHWFGSGWH